jgi:cob(I)alamin adenosyltransferase
VLHHARTVCRNAERWVSALGDQEPVNPFVQVYLNRLGDFLFIAARKTNLDDGKEEKAVTYE